MDIRVTCDGWEFVVWPGLPDSVQVRRVDADPPVQSLLILGAPVRALSCHPDGALALTTERVLKIGRKPVWGVTPVRDEAELRAAGVVNVPEWRAALPPKED